jgi:predicted dehydrogenase
VNGRGVLVVGCGDISDRYALDIGRQPHLRLVGAVDLAAERAQAFAERHGVRAYADLREALADPAVEIVANLTGHRAHAPVSRAAIEAGRHVFSEKPLALTATEAHELVRLAEQRGVLLGGAPIVPLGELVQTARRWIEEGRLGPLRLAYAEVNWGRIEAWHPDAKAFYDVGPLFDVGVYPLTLTASLLGPFRRIASAYATQLLPERRTAAGGSYEFGAPDFVSAVLVTAGGAAVRLTANFYVADPARQRGVELHGDDGSLWLSNWFQFGGTLEYAPHGEPYRPVPLLREPEVGLPWALGLEDLALAIEERRSPRADGALAAHVVEAMEAIITAATTGRPVDLESAPVIPPPPGWAASLPLPVAKAAA